MSHCFLPSQEENEKLIVRWNEHVTSKYFYNFTRFRHFITFRMLALKVFSSNFSPLPSSKSSKMCSVGCKKKSSMEIFSLLVMEFITRNRFMICYEQIFPLYELLRRTECRTCQPTREIRAASMFSEIGSWDTPSLWKRLSNYPFSGKVFQRYVTNNSMSKGNPGRRGVLSWI